MINVHSVFAVIKDMKDVIMMALVVPRYPVLCQYLAGCLRVPPEAQANKKLPDDSNVKPGLKSLCLHEKFQCMTAE